MEFSNLNGYDVKDKNARENINTLDKQVNTSNYYDEITYEKKRYYHTDCYISIIPKRDNNNNLINIYVNKDTKSPNEYAKSNKTTLTINGGLSSLNSQDVWEQNLTIGNGEILYPVPDDITLADHYKFVGFDEGRNVHEYQANTLTAEQALNDGVVNGYVAFYRYMNNGELEEHPEANNWSVESPRMDMGIKDNGDLVILACDGRTNNNIGLDNEQALSIMQEYGCVKAWRGDGGGSTSLNIKGIKINRNIDNSGVTDRAIGLTFNVKKETVNDELAKVYSEISEQKQLLNKQIRNDLNRVIDDHNQNMTLLNWNTGINVISENETPQVLQFQDGYRKGDVIEPIKNENNRHIGFKVNKLTMVKISITATIVSKVGYGVRGLRIYNENNQLPNQGCMVNDYYEVENNNNTKVISATFLINNTVVGSEYKIMGRGNQNDDISRLCCVIEDIGPSI